MSIFSDIDTLITAVNNDDTLALLALADAMEEGGNPRTATGLRLASAFKPHKCTWKLDRRPRLIKSPDSVPEEYYYRMTDMMRVGGGHITGGLCGDYGTFRCADSLGEDTIRFQSPCDAYVALADAIMEYKH